MAATSGGVVNPSKEPDADPLAPHIAQLCDAIITARLHLADVAGGMREADRLVRARMREIVGARS